MAGDWLDEYVEAKQDQWATNKVNLLLAQRAEGGAPRLFRVLADRVRDDVERYQTQVGGQGLQFYWRPSREFVVSRSQYPAVALTVTLKGVTIEYRHSVRRDDTDSARPTEGYFRIGADLAGNVQARQGEKWFTDAAEISAALLKPVFDALP
jgi:hypothetical protein